MTNTPKISVIMPNYNGEKFLAEAIESILQQTFSDFEFIIIDDGSIDGSWGIIQSYAVQDERIVAIKNKQNLKICKTLNKWIEIAKWEYIARMDSDDIALPFRLGSVYEIISTKPKIGVCWSNFEVIDGYWKKIWSKVFPESDDECRKSIRFRNPFAHNTVIIRKDALTKYWWYNDDYVYAEDLELWIRIGQHYEFYNVQKELVQYRIYWDNSILKKQKTMIKNALRARKKAIELWYYISTKWRFFLFWTRCMQFFPPKFVLWFFNLINI